MDRLSDRSPADGSFKEKRMYDQEATNNLSVAVLIDGVYHFTSEAVERADELLLAALAEVEE